MALELVINAIQDGFRIACLKEGELFEYHVEERDKKFSVGDIYLGTIKKLADNLNAAFVDIGYKKDAFLHATDLGDCFNTVSKFTKQAINGKITDGNLSNITLEPISSSKFAHISEILQKNSSILVQVIKEPISNKGPRLSAELSLAGRYMILVPFSQTINISKRIASKEERKRLLRLISSIKPTNFGLIIRTAAEGKAVIQLAQDLNNLIDKWEKVSKF